MLFVSVRQWWAGHRARIIEESGENSWRVFLFALRLSLVVALTAPLGFYWMPRVALTFMVAYGLSALLSRR